MSIKARIAAFVAASLLSVAGFTHIMNSEGLRLTAYGDPATGGAPWTICYGHTGPDVYRGLTVTREQCELWLRQDTAKAERAVQRRVTRGMRQGEYDSHVSFVFNVGEGKYATSTLLRKFNAGDRVGSCNEFPRWKYANGKVLQGIVVRRFEEQEMCLTYGPIIYAPKSP